MVELPVTVVIPAWRRAATIRRCLASVLGEEIRPAEVIVVDDASGDDTADVARSSGAGSVRVLEQPRNAGAQAARNRGIREARHGWIAFLDSDDEWLPGKLGRQWDLLGRMGFPEDAVLHGNCLRFQGGREDYWDLPSTEGIDARRLLLARPAPMFQGMLVSKAHLLGIGLLDESAPAYQEWDTSIRLSANGRLFHDREPLFRYHLHDGETISGSPVREAKGHAHVVFKHEADIRATAGEGAWNAHMARLGELSLLSDLPDFSARAADHATGATRALLRATTRLGRLPWSRPFFLRLLARQRSRLGGRHG